MIFQGKRDFYVSKKFIKVLRVIGLSFRCLGVKMSKIAKVVEVVNKNCKNADNIAILLKIQVYVKTTI